MKTTNAVDIWFCSDPHYGHKNITQGESSWDTTQACRPFETVSKMNDTLVNNINSCVKENDILYCLGDWAFGGKENIVEFRRRLHVKTIHLILGNHDHHIANDKGILYNNHLYHNESLFTSVQHYLNKKINGQNIVMSHYPMRSWEKGHHGAWMLHGHCHGTLPDYSLNGVGKFKTIDVGFDTHLEFKPYHFDDIKKIMDERVPLKVDHHGPNTN